MTTADRNHRNHPRQGTDRQDAPPGAPRPDTASAEDAAAEETSRIPKRGAREDQDNASAPEKEIGGRGGLDPVRYGDWEKNGRCIDF